MRQVGSEGVCGGARSCGWMELRLLVRGAEEPGKGAPGWLPSLFQETLSGPPPHHTHTRASWTARLGSPLRIRGVGEAAFCSGLRRCTDLGFGSQLHSVCALSCLAFFFSTMEIIIAYVKGAHRASKK